MRSFKVRLRPHDVVVYFSKKLLKKKNRRQHELLGLTIADSLEIYVSPIGGSMERETVLHELLHMIWYMSGASTLISHKKEEELISIITPHLLNLLIDNPDIYRYLVDNNEV